jgi:hypothetical protein
MSIMDKLKSMFSGGSSGEAHEDHAPAETPAPPPAAPMDPLGTTPPAPPPAGGDEPRH